jgi:hypothetical protein
MAKYYVNYSCGHEGRVELYGKGADRERKIAYYEKYGVCPECYKEQKRIEAEAEAEKNGLKETEVSYREYKLNYPDAKTVPGSYNGETKTIKIYI